MRAAILRRRIKAAESPGSQRYLEAALAAITDAVITTDLADRITYMNAAAQGLTGWRHAEAVTQQLANVFAIVHAQTGAAIDIAAGEIEQSDEAASWFGRRAKLPGHSSPPLLIEYKVVPIRGADSVVCGAVIVFRDIADQGAGEWTPLSNEETLHEQADALFEEKERSQVTLNSIGDAVISTDFRGRVSFLNIIAEQMTGWTQADAAGRPLDEIFVLVDSTSREQISCPTMKAIIEDRRIATESACVLINKHGKEIAVEDSASPIHDKNGGVIGAVMVAHDVSAARELSEKLARLALYDSLTELPNRALFADRLHQALVRARRNGGCAAVLFIDLDGFKPVNDSLGHAVGDLLLRAVSQRLLTCVRSSDAVSRHGGDEFIFLIADIAHFNDATLCAEKVKRAFDKPYDIGPHTIKVTASIGIAGFPLSASDAETLIKYADIAMYEAKRTGRNNYQWFRDELLSGAPA